jgi:tetratricopeptide (TPR) repeat protein
VRRAAALAVAVAAAACAPLPPLERGLQFYQEGRYREAVAAFDEAVQESPGSAAAYTNRGVARIRLGDAGAAIEDFTRALALTPDDPEVLFNRGNAHIITGAFAAAVADLTRAVELRPDFPRALFNRGIARERAGDLAGARRDWARAIELERDPRVRAAMERRAGGLARRAAARSGERLDARALADRGLDRELAGDRAGALADLKAALTLETDPQRRAGIENLLRLLDDGR